MGVGVVSLYCTMRHCILNCSTLYQMNGACVESKYDPPLSVAEQGVGVERRPPVSVEAKLSRDWWQKVLVHVSAPSTRRCRDEGERSRTAAGRQPRRHSVRERRWLTMLVPAGCMCVCVAMCFCGDEGTCGPMWVSQM